MRINTRAIPAEKTDEVLAVNGNKTIDISGFAVANKTLVLLVGFNKEYVVKFETSWSIKGIINFMFNNIFKVDKDISESIEGYIDQTSYVLLKEDLQQSYAFDEYGKIRKLLSIDGLNRSNLKIKTLVNGLHKLRNTVRAISIYNYSDYNIPSGGMERGVTVKDWNAKDASYDAHPSVIRDEKITPNQVREVLGLDAITIEKTEDILKPKSYEMADGRSVYDWMSVLFQSNPNLTSDDIMYLTLMLKYIPRAGSKIYPGMTAEESKNADLDKVVTIVKDWQDKRKGVK